MVFLYVLELLIMALFLVALVTQVALPMALGRPLFPFFTWRKAQTDLAAALDDVEAAQLEQTVKSTKQTAKSIRKGAF